MKNLFKIAFVAAFAAIAGYNIYSIQKTDGLSDLALANIEALASGESSKPCEQVCERQEGWQCTRILNGVTSVCSPYRVKR
jgi:hypothetical protein